MQTAEGGPLGHDGSGHPIRLVKDCYALFLNAAKAANRSQIPGFQSVGTQGLEQVSGSDVDVLYAEFWPWGQGARRPAL